MILFLTSSPCIGWGDSITPMNGLIDRLHTYLPGKRNGLFIASSPDDTEVTEKFGYGTRDLFVAIGIEFADFRILDSRNAADAQTLIANSDFIILAGGHVPTQNAFFANLHLKELLCDYDGVILGISAGTMNSAETVYAQPEVEGESIDPNYRRFLPGLALTRQQILPHYNLEKDAVLDGKRLYDDITYSDSLGHSFLVFPDGTYLFSENGKETIFGEAFLLKDGILNPICGDGNSVVLS